MVRRVLRHIPSREDLKGGLLHRIVGERLFSASLWRPTKVQVAGGLALGVFVGLTPTMGVQMIIAGIAAFLLRVNIPASLAACWITNPISAPFIYTLQYQFGVYLTGVHCDPELLRHYSTLLKDAVRMAKPLWVGSLVSAAFFTPLTYLVAFFSWQQIARVIESYRWQEATKQPTSSGSGSNVDAPRTDGLSRGFCFESAKQEPIKDRMDDRLS